MIKGEKGKRNWIGKDGEREGYKRGGSGRKMMKQNKRKIGWGRNDEEEKDKGAKLEEVKKN